MTVIEQRNTRDRLMSATEELMVEGGLAAVTTQSVARSAGVAEGTIYRHFGSRDELVETTIRERLSCGFAELADALVKRAGQRTVGRNLQEFIANAMPLFEVMAPSLSMLAANRALAQRHCEARRECGGAQPSALVETYFKAEQQLGRVRKDICPKTVANMLIGVCFHRSLLRHIFGEDPNGCPDAELPAAVAAIVSQGVEESAKP